MQKGLIRHCHQEKRHDPLNSEKMSLSKSDLRFSSYRRYRFINERTAHGKNVWSVFYICGHVYSKKKRNSIMVLIKLVLDKIG